MQRSWDSSLNPGSCNILTQIPVLPSHFHASPVRGLPVSTSYTSRKILHLITEIGFCAVQCLCKGDPFSKGAKQAWGQASSVFIALGHLRGICFHTSLHWLPYFESAIESSKSIYLFQAISSGCFRQHTLVWVIQRKSWTSLQDFYGPTGIKSALVESRGFCSWTLLSNTHKGWELLEVTAQRRAFLFRVHVIFMVSTWKVHSAVNILVVSSDISAFWWKE